MSYTRGEWRALLNGVYDKRNIRICDYRATGLTNLEEIKANAQLIASAPRLLEACKSAVRERMLHGDIPDSITEIKKAIKSAEGGES